MQTSIGEQARRRRRRRRRRTVSSTSGRWDESQQKSAAAAGARPSGRAGQRRRGWRRGWPRGGWSGDWLLLIPEYDGCPYGLDRFAESVRWVASRLGRGLERALLLALGGKLRGEARRSHRHKLQRYPSVEHLLRALYWQFSGVGSEALLLEELRSARQRQHETLTEYARRVDRLATQICSIYAGGFCAADADIADERRQHHRRLVTDSALASFRRGLASLDLELCLAGCEPESFDEALALAIALDRRLQAS